MKNKRLNVWILSAVVLLALFSISLLVGSYELSIDEILRIISRETRDTIEEQVFLELRVPRTVMGLISGMALGIAGATFQTIFKNPLASPDLTCVASGASFGAALAIVNGYSAPIQLIASSFIGGVCSLLLVLLLVAMTKVKKISNFLFAGIIIKCVADALLMVLKTMADPESELAAIEFWIMGSLASVTRSKIMIPSIVIIIAIIVILLCYMQITMLTLSDKIAIASGLNPNFWRILLLVITTLLIASVVSVVGTVAFVGLIAPHISMLFLKKRGFSYLLMSAVIGGGITLLADVIARSVGVGVELPLSIPIIFLSIPILASLVLKTRGNHYGLDN